MKSLRESLLDDDLINKTDEYIKDEIKAFLIENYKGLMKISRNPNADGKYEVSSSSNIGVKNKNITSLTNGVFIWTAVNGSFEVLDCKSLKSLEGAPKKVGEDFYCSSCDSLTSLKGAPEKVGGDFYCDYNKSLKSLDGAPKEVGGDFDCSGCESLESLEGAPKEIIKDFKCANCQSLKILKGVPEKVGGGFNCSFCGSLKSLDGAPKEVGGNFECKHCKIKFIENDIKKVSNVKKDIIC